MNQTANARKKLIAVISSIALLGVIFAIPFASIGNAAEEVGTTASNNSTQIVEISKPSFNKEGFTDEAKWEKALSKVKKSYKGYSKKCLKKYSDYMTSKHKKSLKTYQKKLNAATTIKAAKSNAAKMKKIVAKAKAKKKVVSSRFKNGPSKSQFMSRGVIYYNGHRHTYYSSNVLYHYRTREWHLDKNSMYRDKDGYLVIAADFIPFGSVINTPWGKAKKYDCGAGANTVDVYVKF